MSCPLKLFIFSPLCFQALELLAQIHALHPLLQREQPTWILRRGAAELRLSVRVSPVSGRRSLRGGRRSPLRFLLRGQPHALLRLQPGLRAQSRSLQIRRTQPNRPLPWFRDGPAGPGAALLAAAPRRPHRRARPLC